MSPDRISCDNHRRSCGTEEAAYLDLRGLLPPEPMVAVLRLIDSGEASDILIAHFDREPLFLYPELEQRGWTHEIATTCSNCSDQDGTKLRLVRST